MRLAAEADSTRPTKVGASTLTHRDRGSAPLPAVGKRTLTAALDPSPVLQMGRAGGVEAQINASTAPGKRSPKSMLPARPTSSGAVTGGALDAVAAMPHGLIVADGSTSPEAQQLTQAAFLAQLRDEVVVAAAAAAGPGWSPSSCPDIPRLFSHYASLEPASCERLMRRYSRLTSASRASDYIAPICARIKGALRRWARGDEVSWNIGASGVPVALERDSGADGAARGGRESTAASSLTLDDLGPGAPIDSATASRMSGAFADNFEDVRIHTDPAAAAKTRELGANALAVGSHVAFASGAYNPGTLSGDGLIAHELAHVIQQRGNEPLVQRRVVGVQASGAHEQDADDVASAVVARLRSETTGTPRDESRAPIRPSLTTALGVQRGNPDNTLGARPRPPFPAKQVGSKRVPEGTCEAVKSADQRHADITGCAAIKIFVYEKIPGPPGGQNNAKVVQTYVLHSDAKKESETTAEDIGKKLVQYATANHEVHIVVFTLRLQHRKQFYSQESALSDTQHDTVLGCLRRPLLLASRSLPNSEKLPEMHCEKLRFLGETKENAVDIDLTGQMNALMARYQPFSTPRRTLAQAKFTETRPTYKLTKALTDAGVGKAGTWRAHDDWEDAYTDDEVNGIIDHAADYRQYDQGSVR